LETANYNILNQQSTGTSHGNRLQQKAQQAVPSTANDQVTDYLAQKALVFASHKWRLSQIRMACMNQEL